MHRKISKSDTILIAGIVFIAGLMIGFGGYVFAGDPAKGLDITICQNPPGPCSRVSDKTYDSSFSKTKSIGLVRKEVGDVLLRYGIGGADINKVTEALEGKGVYEAELKSFLLAIGINEKDAQDILLEFDKIGIGTTEDTPQALVNQELHRPPTSVGEGQLVPVVQKTREMARTFNDEAANLTEKMKAAGLKEQREDIRKELQANRQTLQKNVQTLRQDLRENAQELRENFRENVKTTIGHVDHGKTGRIALAHGKGLRMLNRFRSAMARFDHILGRLESRIEKIEARGIDISSVVPLIEEAKNMQVENEAKMEELKTKYESLLLGENAGGIAKEAREIAKELKSEIEKLRGLLDDIKLATGNYNSSLSNKDK